MENRAIDRTISPHDGMFIPGQEAHYFESCRSAVHNIRTALAAAQLQDPQSILDMACGYGRVLRGIRAAFPQAEITACDIDARAVDYCAETFNVNRIYSSRQFDLSGQSGTYDLIWIGSLLTHLKQPAWVKLFDLCKGILSQSGLLVFTAHGHHVARMISDYGYHYGLHSDAALKTLDAFEKTGFGFGSYPNQPEYGISVTSPSWVLSFIDAHTDLQVCFVNEMGWDLHQDVYACFPRQALFDREIAAYVTHIAERELLEAGEGDLELLFSHGHENELDDKVHACVEKHVARDSKAYGPRVRRILVRELTDRLQARLGTGNPPG